MNHPIALLAVLIQCLIALPVQAKFELWTRKDGKSANLKLVDTSGDGDKLVGHFVLANGQKFQIKASDLTEADAKRLADAAKILANGGSLDGSSVYDSFFRDGLVKLSAGRMQPYRLEENPNKYFVFYHTASWCGPCREFLPMIQGFDKEFGAKKDFQIIVVSSDDNGNMMKYAKARSIEWPHIKNSQISMFEKTFPHPGGGIPNVVITDLQGKIVASSYQGNQYYGAKFSLISLQCLLTGAPMPKISTK